MDKDKIKDKPEFAVKVHIPENVPEHIKKQKINKLYDILKPKDKKCES